ncbi:hypothetical protein [Halorubellus salinus]|uniref:hypothetical protein n=1 Tax=Halorubellus salinus TaxID=755309 RepID=UPI001D0618BC|nr:hypothetical protein [Halorubellus salinus]
MTEFESPATLVAARAATLARATASRLNGPGGMERPSDLEPGFGTSDVGVPSLVASLIFEAMQDGAGGQEAGSEPPVVAVKTGVAVEALDRQGQALATVLSRSEGADDEGAVTELVLWCDWLHARGYQLLLGGSASCEGVLSAVRTMGREVASRNACREADDSASEPVLAVPSGVVDEAEAVSVFVRGSGCSCAVAARIGGLVGGAGPDALERAVTSMDGDAAGIVE